MATLLILVGLIALVIGVIALLRGHIGWARIPNRHTAVVVSLVAFGVMLAGGALTPTPDATPVSDRILTTSPTASLPTTSTSTTTARKTPTTTAAPTSTTTTTPPPRTTTLTPAPAPAPSTEVAIAPFVPPAPAPPAPSRGTTGGGTSGGGTSGGGWDDCVGGYINTAGNCIPSPQQAPQAPAGATAKCNDGTYSFSQSRRGTCSRHGGVASWL